MNWSTKRYFSRITYFILTYMFPACCFCHRTFSHLLSFLLECG